MQQHYIHMMAMYVHVYWGLQGVTEFMVATDETGWKWGFAMNADIVWKEV